MSDRDELAEVIIGGPYPTRAALDIADVILSSPWLAERGENMRAEGRGPVTRSGATQPNGYNPFPDSRNPYRPSVGAVPADAPAPTAEPERFVGPPDRYGRYAPTAEEARPEPIWVGETTAVDGWR